MLTRVPVVYHAHNVMSDELDRYFRRPPARLLARQLGGWLDRRLPRRADGVVALSEAVADHLRVHGVDSDRLQVVPPGAFPRGEGRDVASSPPGSNVVVYAGNLDPYQDLDTLLEAMIEVRRAEPSAVLEVVTHAACRRLEQQSQRLGLSGQVRLIVVENYTAVRPVLERASVLVCPRTSWSGFPIKLLNYMAAGRPMVVGGGVGRRAARPGWAGPSGAGVAPQAAREVRLAAPRPAHRGGLRRGAVAPRRKGW
jgi:glycosyltransferase involved in cell wall biosynthesis